MPRDLSKNKFGIINSIFNLAYLFEKIAGGNYDEFRQMVEQKSAQNPYPFKDWFGPNGRVYLEFKPEQEIENNDKYVIQLLNDNGWEVVDYVAGLAQKNNRKMRIGKIINQIYKEENNKTNKELSDAQQRNIDEFEFDAIKQKADNNLKYIKEIENDFINSPSRSGGKTSGLSIIISQNPHDLASMSTGRSWESCMTLGTGGHHEDVYCEVAGGGLVAYLIDSTDTEINRPHARIHIRRFDSRDGKSIAIPEESVYGNDVSGFLENVKDWINEKNGNVLPGLYERKGGKWSDTFSETHLVTPNIDAKTPEGQNELVKWINGEFNEDFVKYIKYDVKDRLYEYYENNSEEWEDAPKNKSASFFSKEEAEKYIYDQMLTDQEQSEEEVFGGEDYYNYGNGDDPRLYIEETIIDNSYDLKNTAGRQLLSLNKEQLSPQALSAMKNLVYDHGTLTPFGRDLYNKYPHIFTKEEVENFDKTDYYKYIKSLPEEEKRPYLNEILRSVNNYLDNSDIQFKDKEKSVIPGNNCNYEILNVFNKNALEPLEVFDQIPADIINKIVNVVQKNIKNFGINDTIQRINIYTLNLLSVKNADTPTVQNYYMNLLTNGYNISLLYQIGKLGENGKQFVPTLYNILNAQKEIYNKNKSIATKNIINNVLWAIDAIENGKGRSEKYTYKH